MAARARFTGFDPYKLNMTGVQVINGELGHGSYATVLELECMGLKCVGKKIHEIVFSITTWSSSKSYYGQERSRECSSLDQPDPYM